MGQANTVTGRGHGSSGKVTTTELSIYANAPQILVAGYAVADNPASPSGFLGTHTLPEALPGGSENYVVILTPIGSESAYVADLNEDSDGNFSGFDFFTSDEDTVMFIVTKVGARPSRRT